MQAVMTAYVTIVIFVLASKNDCIIWNSYFLKTMFDVYLNDDHCNRYPPELRDVQLMKPQTVTVYLIMTKMLAIATITISAILLIASLDVRNKLRRDHTVFILFVFFYVGMASTDIIVAFYVAALSYTDMRTLSALMSNVYPKVTSTDAVETTRLSALALGLLTLKGCLYPIIGIIFIILLTYESLRYLWRGPGVARVNSTRRMLRVIGNSLIRREQTQSEEIEMTGREVVPSVSTFVDRYHNFCDSRRTTVRGRTTAGEQLRRFAMTPRNLPSAPESVTPQLNEYVTVASPPPADEVIKTISRTTGEYVSLQEPIYQTLDSETGSKSPSHADVPKAGEQVWVARNGQDQPASKRASQAAVRKDGEQVWVRRHSLDQPASRRARKAAERENIKQPDSSKTRKIPRIVITPPLLPNNLTNSIVVHPRATTTNVKSPPPKQRGSFKNSIVVHPKVTTTKVRSPPPLQRGPFNRQRIEKKLPSWTPTLPSIAEMHFEETWEAHLQARRMPPNKQDAATSTSPILLAGLKDCSMTPGVAPEELQLAEINIPRPSYGSPRFNDMREAPPGVHHAEGNIVGGPYGSPRYTNMQRALPDVPQTGRNMVSGPYGPPMLPDVREAPPGVHHAGRNIVDGSYGSPRYTIMRRAPPGVHQTGRNMVRGPYGPSMFTDERVAWEELQLAERNIPSPSYGSPRFNDMREAPPGVHHAGRNVADGRNGSPRFTNMRGAPPGVHQTGRNVVCGPYGPPMFTDEQVAPPGVCQARINIVGSMFTDMRRAHAAGCQAPNVDEYGFAPLASPSKMQQAVGGQNAGDDDYGFAPLASPSMNQPKKQNTATSTSPMLSHHLKDYTVKPRAAQAAACQTKDDDEYMFTPSAVPTTTRQDMATQVEMEDKVDLTPEEEKPTEQEPTEVDVIENTKADEDDASNPQQDEFLEFIYEPPQNY